MMRVYRCTVLVQYQEIPRRGASQMWSDAVGHSSGGRGEIGEMWCYANSQSGTIYYYSHNQYYAVNDLL